MPVPEQICYATPAALASMQGDASKRDYAAERVCADRYLHFITCCESQYSCFVDRLRLCIYTATKLIDSSPTSPT